MEKNFIAAFISIGMVFDLYLLPGVVASSRRHRNAAAIWVLDVFLGWTVLGWIIALVWSMTNERRA